MAPPGRQVEDAATASASAAQLTSRLLRQR